MLSKGSQLLNHPQLFEVILDMLPGKYILPLLELGKSHHETSGAAAADICVEMAYRGCSESDRNRQERFYAILSAVCNDERATRDYAVSRFEGAFAHAHNNFPRFLEEEAQKAQFGKIIMYPRQCNPMKTTFPILEVSAFCRVVLYDFNMEPTNCFAANLTHVDLSLPQSMSELKFGKSFVTPSLKVFSLKGTESLLRIHSDFLSGAEALTDVAFAQMKSVTTIDNSFMSSCRRIIAIDLRSFTSVTTIGDGFLSGCSQLEEVVGLSHAKAQSSILGNATFAELTTIGAYFCFNCHELREQVIDLTHLTKVSKIDRAFFGGRKTDRDQTKLSEAVLSLLPKISRERFGYE